MNLRFVCFGEVLFDVLPKAVKAGGAPMNVAYHLVRLGNKAAIISRVGNDARGKELTTILKDKNISRSHLQIDPAHDTSIVVASPNPAGDMEYDIVENVAWDYIELKPNYESLIKNAGYFIFGSLVTRSHVSRSTLFNLLDVHCKRVFDINLRSPFINQKNIEYQLNKTDILKMNEEELDFVSGWYVQFNNIEDKVRFLQNKFQIATLIVTRGAKGAVVNHQGLFYYQEGFQVPVVDTLGSGDGFLAGFLSEMIKGRPIDDALSFACSLGAFVATKSGGCPDYKVEDIQQFDKSLTLNSHL